MVGGKNRARGGGAGATQVWITTMEHRTATFGDSGGEDGGLPLYLWMNGWDLIGDTPSMPKICVVDPTMGDAG
jgi:hypothetical protein